MGYKYGGGPKRRWLRKARHIGGRTYKVVFQGMVQDFPRAEINKKTKALRDKGYSTRSAKRKTHRGMEWVVWASKK